LVTFLNPENILNQLELREDMLVAEFGCGSGVFAIALAKRLSDGRVYALDIQPEVLSALAAKATQEKILNLQLVHCDLEKEDGSGLQNNLLDLVLIPNVLFQAEDKKAILKEAFRVLKKGGQCLIIDWKKQSVLGPKYSRISAGETEELAQQAGLEFKKELDAGQNHYALLFEKI